MAKNYKYAPCVSSSHEQTDIFTSENKKLKSNQASSNRPNAVYMPVAGTGHIMTPSFTSSEVNARRKSDLLF